MLSAFVPELGNIIGMRKSYSSKIICYITLIYIWFVLGAIYNVFLTVLFVWLPLKLLSCSLMCVSVFNGFVTPLWYPALYNIIANKRKKSKYNSPKEMPSSSRKLYSKAGDLLHLTIATVNLVIVIIFRELHGQSRS